MAKNIKQLKNKSYQLKTVKFFPHISRKINAGFEFLVIVFFFSIILFNFLPLKPTPSRSPASHLEGDINNLKTAVLKNPRNPPIHLNLVNLLLKSNQINEAENEVFSALQFSPDNSSLLQKLEEIRKTKNEPQRINEEIQKWEKIVLAKPDYRDAYFQLAILHYQLYNDKQAKEYLEKTLSLDPNFDPAKKLIRVIETN